MSLYGPVKERGEWRVRYSKELCQLYISPDSITSIRVSMLRWAGRVERIFLRAVWIASQKEDGELED
jgi:hypothetical protein